MPAPSHEPCLRFTPTAWAKLVCLRDLGQTEVGGFAISAEGDPLLVEDVQMVRQFCTAVTVMFDDQSVADYFDQQVDLGHKPERFCRVWVHTHPGNSPHPSSTDEDTFERVFGAMEWAVMFILAEGGQTYARLRFNVGPGGQMKIPVAVDYTRPFAASDFERWQQEYTVNLFDEDRVAWESRRQTAATDKPNLNTAADVRDFADPFFDPLRGEPFNELDERRLFREELEYGW